MTFPICLQTKIRCRISVQLLHSRQIQTRMMSLSSKHWVINYCRSQKSHNRRRIHWIQLQKMVRTLKRKKNRRKKKRRTIKRMEKRRLRWKSRRNSNLVISSKYILQMKFFSWLVSIRRKWISQNYSCNSMAKMLLSLISKNNSMN